MNEAKHRGRVTIPTDVDVVPETLEILERGAAVLHHDGLSYSCSRFAFHPADAGRFR